MNARAVLLAFGLSACGAGSARAVGGSLTEGAVTLTYPAAHWSANPATSFVGTEIDPAASFVHEMGWFYRAQGDTREYPLPPPDSEVYGSGVLEAHWADLDGKGFEMYEDTWICDNEGPSGAAWSFAFVNNNNAVSRTFTLFHYLDASSGGTPGSDIAVLRSTNNFIKITDGVSTVRYRSVEATNYQVGAFPTLRDALNDASVTDLNESGFGAPAGNVTAAYEWTKTLPAGFGMVADVSVSSRLPYDHVRGAYFNMMSSPALLTAYPGGVDPFGTRAMCRSSFIQASAGSFLPAGQEYEDVDDFDGDGSDELLTRDPATGATQIDGNLITGAPNLPPNWKIAATGDLSYDQKADILWRNTTSQKLVVWMMDHHAKIGSIIPSPDQAVNANWEVAGLADFNGDFTKDILWYNQTSGNIVIWYMDASVQRITGAFTVPAGVGDNNWRIAAVGDFGKGAGGMWNTSDIVWQNDTSHKLVVWFMDHAGTRTSGSYTTPDNAGATAVVIGPR